MSDWFVVTAPYTQDSKGMIGARELSLMKPTAHLVIISRGGIVDEDALYDTLESGRIAGAELTHSRSSRCLKTVRDGTWRTSSYLRTPRR